MLYNGQWACLPFVLEEDTVFITLDGTYNCPLLWRETLSFKMVIKHAPCSGGRLFLSLEHFLYTHSFKDSSEQRAISTSLSRCAEMWDNHGDLSSDSGNLIYGFCEKNNFRWWQFLDYGFGSSWLRSKWI